MQPQGYKKLKIRTQKDIGKTTTMHKWAGDLYDPTLLRALRHRKVMGLFALGSRHNLYVLSQVPRSSLTVYARPGLPWASALPDLAALRSAFSPALVYYDLPHDLLQAFLPLC